MLVKKGLLIKEELLIKRGLLIDRRAVDRAKRKLILSGLGTKRLASQVFIFTTAAIVHQCLAEL